MTQAQASKVADIAVRMLVIFSTGIASYAVGRVIDHESRISVLESVQQESSSCMRTIDLRLYEMTITLTRIEQQVSDHIKAHDRGAH
jgi:hypothetical protein